MSKLRLFLIVTVLLAMALPAVAQGDASWAERVSINGYFQARYEALKWANAQDDFGLRRMYINMMVDANERTKAVITWTRIGPDPALTSSTDWANIFVDYMINDQWTARIGQGPDWFGLETMQGSSARMALERAAVLEGGYGARPLGLYFAGPWDRGVWFVRKPDGNEPMAILGIWNGQFRAGDQNTNKTISVDLKWHRPWGEFGASWMDGEWTNDDYLGRPLGGQPLGTTQDRSAMLGYVRWAPPNSDWAFQSECVEGELFGNDIDGYYAQLERSGLTEGGTGFVKVEQYDPDTATANNAYEAVHVGYSQWLDQNNELTIQYTDGELKGASDESRDKIAVQWQFGFR